MGKSSSSNSSSETTNTMGKINMSNPYYKTKTNPDGTVSTTLNKGTAMYGANDFINKNYKQLLKNYQNPTLDDPTIQANIQLFNKNLNDTARQQMQNSIINPLSSNNMVRSSQATNMYNNMYNQMNDAISDYMKEQIAGARDMYGSMLDRYSNIYGDIAQGVSANQSTGINAALGNNKSNTNSNSKAK